MGKRVAIVQSNYVPWRGYFDMIASVDEFVLFDDVQYTKRDWRNRNKIKTADGGTRWLSIPVEVSGRYEQAICETNIADEAWTGKHWDIVRQTYARAGGFDVHGPFVEELYGAAPGPSLSAVNHHFLTRICERLEITTPITWSMDYAPQGAKTDRLLDVCLKAGATEYVSGPAARAYLDEDRFAAEGIGVRWFEYGDYPEYEQVHPPFEPRVSILDVLLCGGEQAASLVRAQERA